MPKPLRPQQERQLEADTLEAGINFVGEGDLVFSGTGEDVIDASTVNSDNRLYGGSDADELFPGSNDRLFGGAGNDTLDASVGNGGNRLYGGAGSDILVAGNDDRLIGNDGDDQFFFPNGGANNVVTGGAGADLFQIKDPDVRLGTNTITDFTAGEDLIGVAGVEASFTDITRTAVDNGTLLSLEGEDLAILLNVEANNLTEADFTFA